MQLNKGDTLVGKCQEKANKRDKLLSICTESHSHKLIFFTVVTCMDCTQLRRNAEQYMMRHPEKENVTSLTH